MADKITIELELAPSLSSKGKKDIQKKSKEAGGKAGDAFEKEFKSKTINLGSIVKSSILNIGAGIAGIGLARTFSEGIRLAQIQEDAVTRLNNSLKLSGDLSSSNSQDLQDYASALQATSRYGDEVILNQLALAKGFGASNDQAKAVASSAVDLAAALGIDLNSATRNVSKTLGGYAGELGELIPELKNLTKEQLQSGAGIDLISKKFAGQGKNLNTFSFAVDGLANSFGDALEGVGEFITKNQALIGVLKGTTGYFNDFAGGLRGIRALLGFEDAPVNKLEELDRAIAKNVDKVQMLKETLADRKEGFFGFVTAGDKRDIAVLPARIEKVGKAIEQQIAQRKVLIAQQIADKKKLEEARNKEAEQVAVALTNDQLVAMSGLTTEASRTEAAFKRFGALEELRANDYISEVEYGALKHELDLQLKEQQDELERQKREKAIETAGDIKGATIEAFNDVSASSLKLGKDLRTLAVNGFGRAFTKIGSALATGKNANEAFVQSVQATAGEAASAFGDYYIKLGVARIAASYGAEGYTTLAAGAGLKVLAGAFSAGGGGGASGGGSASSGGSSSSPASLEDTTALEEQDVERNQPNTNVEVVVQGSLVQQEELGTFIAETLSDSFGKQGVALTDARIS